MFKNKEKLNHLQFLKNVYLLRERERECSGEGGQRERERENPKLAPHCQCRAWHGTQSHNCEIVIGAEIKSWTLN